MEARPTEYCGIKFKSKSEARIAHLFTTLGIAWLRIIHNVYEFKPKRPTETYMVELSQRFEKVGGTIWGKRYPGSGWSIRGGLIIGGMGFQKAESRYAMRGVNWGPWRDGWGLCDSDGEHIDVEEMLAEQKNYRFDLDNSELE